MIKMNQSEDLNLKFQKVKLAIAEVKEHRNETDKQRRLKLEALSKIKKAIKLKSIELKIDLDAA
tara:strand:- start:3647 stop:3838 length:192 start_codon:yes stop_codon:yes gene_type:complete